nr:hypothetical protein [Tanacetum cinerariifolium]
MRELMEREVRLLKTTEGCIVPLSPPANTNLEETGDSIEKLFDDNDQEHAVEKSNDVLEETIATVALEVVAEKARKNERESLLLPFAASDGSSIPSGATKPLIAAFVALVSDAGTLDSVSPATDASVVTIAVTTTVDADVATGSKAKDMSKDFKNVGDSTSAGGNLDTETMHRVYITRWKVTNDTTLEDPYVCQDLTDCLAPPALCAQLRVMDYD